MKLHKGILWRGQLGMSGFDFLGLVAAVGALAALAVPLYLSHDDGAKMREANLHYRSAIEIVNEHKVEYRVGVALGRDDLQDPRDAKTWISRFSSQYPGAPDGGPAFVANLSGNDTTGAIGVAIEHGAVVLTQPQYLDLVSHTTRVSRDGI